MSYKSRNEYKTFARQEQIVTLWGNENSKYMNEEILYESEQVLVVKFKMFCNDPQFPTIEHSGRYLPELHMMHFEYIHKVDGVYHHVGWIERLKVINVCSGIAHLELVILKPNGSDTYIRDKNMSSTCPQYSLPTGRGGAHYPCSTKNDVCRMRRWTLIEYDDLIKKVITVENAPKYQDDSQS